MPGEEMMFFNLGEYNMLGATRSDASRPCAYSPPLIGERGG